MQLSDLFQMLSYGELSNHHMASAGDGTIAFDKHPQIINFCNEALLRLYSRYVLKEGNATIELEPDEAIYPILSKSNNSNSLFVKKSISRVIRVLSVTSNLNVVRPVNDLNSEFRVTTVGVDSVQVITRLPGEVLTVSYQASHPAIQLHDGGYKTIELPEVLNGALTAFIAYKVYFNMNTPESLTIAQGHLAMFDSVCADNNETDSLSLTTGSLSERFDLRGWK